MATKTVAYPMVIEEFNDEKSEHYFIVTSPDIQGVIGDGPTLADALVNAEDALGGILLVMQDHHQPVPISSNIETIQQKYASQSNVFVTWVAVDLEEAAKKSLSIVENNTHFEARNYKDEVVLAASSREKLSQILDNYELKYKWEEKSKNS